MTGPTDAAIDPTLGTTLEPRLGFRRLDPPPARDELSAFYESRYYDLLRKGGRAPDLRRLLEGDESAARERAWLVATLYDDVAHLLEQAGAGRRVLDVGCGPGELLLFLRERGYQVSGVEPMDSAAAAARARGLQVCTGSVSELLPAARASFDVVTSINVLEHVPDPIELLGTIAQLLRPGGQLVVRVPNDFSELQEAARRALGVTPWWIARPDHVTYFDFASLRRTLTACGFQVLEELADFPMELLLLMGHDYVRRAEEGSACHARRVAMELALPPPLRRRIYRALAAVGVGRNALLLAELRTGERSSVTDEARGGAADGGTAT